MVEPSASTSSSTSSINKGNSQLFKNPLIIILLVIVFGIIGVSISYIKYRIKYQNVSKK
jgi:hypothetical protein